MEENEYIDDLINFSKDEVTDDVDDDKSNTLTYTFAGKKYHDLDKDTIDSIEKFKAALPLVDRKTALQLLEKLSKDPKAFKTKIEDYSSKEHHLLKTLEIFTDQHALLSDIVKKSLDDGIQFANSYVYEKSSEDEDVPSETITLEDSYPSFSKSFNGKVLKGKDVKIYTLTKMKNIKKVLLPNSGIYVLIQGPSLSDLDLLYNRLIDSLGEYGYMFGSYFYLYHDFQIKEIFMEFLHKLVVGSNLKEWEKLNNFNANISIHDYHVLLHTVVSLMFKTGYEYRISCFNKGCTHSEIENININIIKQYLLSKIPGGCVEQLTKRNVKSIKLLNTYRKTLDLTSEYTPYQKYKFHLKVPTIGEYFDFGSSFNTDMIKNIHDVTDQQKISNYLRYSYFKIFTPWIDKIEVLNDDDSINYIINDVAGISFTIDQIQNEYDDDYSQFIDPIINFIKASTLTLMAIPINVCPKCNQLPESDIAGYVPIDIQETFFSMLTMRLLLK